MTKKRTDPILTVTKSNEVYLFSKKVEAANLEQEIRKALNDVGSETLLLRGDKNVFLGEAVDLMAIAKKAGREEHRHPDPDRPEVAPSRGEPAGFAGGAPSREGMGTLSGFPCQTMRHIATRSVSRKQNRLTPLLPLCIQKLLTAQNYYVVIMHTAWHMGCKDGE